MRFLWKEVIRMDYEMELSELEQVTGGMYAAVQKSVLEETGDYRILKVSDPFRTDYYGVCKLCGNVEKSYSLQTVRSRLGLHLFAKHR